MLRPPIELPFFSNDGLPIFVLNWSFRSSIFTAQLGDIMQLFHVSTASGFFCLLCQAIDVDIFVCLDVSLEPFVGICILFSFPCLFRSGAIVVRYAFLLPPLHIFFYSGYQSHAPFNDFLPLQKLSFGGRQSNVSMTIVVFISSCQFHGHVRSSLDHE